MRQAAQAVAAHPVAHAKLALGSLITAGGFAYLLGHFAAAAILR